MLKFSTKADENGNTLQLLVDIEGKTFNYGYFIFYQSSEVVILSKKEIGKLVSQISRLNFRQI